MWLPAEPANGEGIRTKAAKESGKDQWVARRNHLAQMVSFRNELAQKQSRQNERGDLD